MSQSQSSLLAGRKHALSPTQHSFSSGDPPSKQMKVSSASDLQSCSHLQSLSSPQASLVPGENVDAGTRGNKSLERYKLELEVHLTCGLCNCLFYTPVALIPCTHVYCGACAKNWLASHESCPHHDCKKRVYGTTDSHSTMQMLDLLLSFYSSYLGRTDEEKREMDAVYRPGTKIPISTAAGAGEEHDTTSDDKSTSRNEHLSRPSEYHPPCPCCYNPNNFVYVCPKPIIPSTYLSYLSRSILPGHKVCSSCNKPFPVRQAEGPPDAYRKNLERIVEYRCIVCKQQFCPPFLADQCASDNKLKRMRDQTIFLDGQKDISEVYNAGLGKFELQIMNDMMTEHYDGPENVIREYMQVLPCFYYRKDDTQYDLRPETTVCVRCLQEALREDEHTTLRQWWRDEYNMLAEEQKLPLEIAKREACWYGFECSEQHESISHAKRYQHLGSPIPEEKRKKGNEVPKEAVQDGTESRTNQEDNPSI
ncbi:hypothetical protein BT69DRAFT_1315705 [Atractiella rhizophila]|nr:hypothetical protein BT69DRAFT_1315705 [Atractiella rhizophila]